MAFKEEILDESFLAHKHNLAQKERRVESDVKLKPIVTAARKAYLNYLSKVDWERVAQNDLADAVGAVGKYVDYAKGIEKRHALFNWRSDYAASIIPEFLYRVFAIRLNQLGIKPLPSMRDSVVEVVVSGGTSGGWKVRQKNQDLCLGLRTDKVLIDGKELSFVVPVVVFEVKTNIDINKLNGLDFSAERLKRTFPTARYFLVTETIDFSLNDNYAAGYIDEIYVLRKQVRSQARRKKIDLQHEVFQELTADVCSLMDRANTDRGHVYDRLEEGTLIHGS